MIGLCQYLTAQSKEIKPKKQKGNLNCIYKQKYSVTQRDKFYPFSIADTIKFVSFRHHRNNYPIKNNILSTDSLVEIKVLTKNETNGLTDILYNNFYKKNPTYGSTTQCFFPRNAILFYDKSGHLKESIVLCFHCDRHQESSDKIDFGSDCTQKMEKLRLYFIALGLNFGTDRNINLYPGEISDE
jgi:hypothetical protein